MRNMRRAMGLLVLIYCGAFLAGYGVADNSTVVVTATEGEQVFLPCDTSSHSRDSPVTRVYFYRQRPYDEVYSYRDFTHKFSETLSGRGTHVLHNPPLGLTIPAVKTSDQGRYSCIVDAQIGRSDARKSYDMFLNVSASEPNTDSVARTDSSGSSIASDPPSINLITTEIRDERLYLEVEPRGNFFGYVTLQILPEPPLGSYQIYDAWDNRRERFVKPFTQYNISVRASSYEGMNVISNVMTFRPPPSKPIVTLEWKESTRSDVTLECFASGSPGPHITFLHNGQVLDEASPNISVETTTYNSTAHLKLTRTYDNFGLYTCSATNLAGTTTETTELGYFGQHKEVLSDMLLHIISLNQEQDNRMRKMEEEMEEMKSLLLKLAD